MMQRPDLQQRMLRCVQCAACRSGCPTFDVTLHEGYSGRGRVILARGLQAGEIAFDERVRTYLETCTRCHWCETVCPVDIPIVSLVEAALARDGDVPARDTTGARRVAVRAHEVLAAGLVRSWPEDLQGPVALHRPCATRFAADCGDVLERVLAQAGAPLSEVEQPNCCGGSEPALGDHQDLMRELPRHYLASLHAAGIRTLISGDPVCARHLKDGATTLNDLNVVSAADVLERLTGQAAPGGPP